MEALRARALDLGRRVSSADMVYDTLRDAIIRGELAEGEALRQEAIAQLFNLSRIPVREAMQRLEAQGLVVSERFKGVVVASLSPDQISEIFDFRALLEPEVIAMATPRMSAASLEEAQALCDAFAVETDPARWGDLNRQFHGRLYRDCAKPYFLAVVEKTSDLVERYVRLVLFLTQGISRAVEEHQAILDACKARDPARAAALTRSHIEGAKATLLACLRERGG